MVADETGFRIISGDQAESCASSLQIYVAELTKIMENTEEQMSVCLHAGHVGGYPGSQPKILCFNGIMR